MLCYSCSCSIVVSAHIETHPLSIGNTEWFRLWMKVFQVISEKDVFTILDYMYHVLQWIFVLQIIHAMFYTINFIHCNIPYSKQADEKSCHKRWKLLIDMSTCICTMEGLICYVLLLIYWHAQHVQCFSFKYEYICWIIHTAVTVILGRCL